MRESRHHTFASWDGTDLFYRLWPASGQSNRALVLLHRGHEHSGRLQGLVDGLDLADVHCFAWDARGHGQSPGRRGHAESFSALVRDLDAFVRHIASVHAIPVEEIAVVANSVGSVIASTWVHDYAPSIRALVLAAPAFDIKLYVPFARTGLRLLQRVKQDAALKSYVRAGFLTHDEDQAAAYDADDAITRDISVRVLLGLYDAADRIVADAGAIHTPTLVLSAGSDVVVKKAPQRRFFDGLSSPRKAYREYPGLYHALYHEKERAAPIADTRAFLQDAFAADRGSLDLVRADEHGYTKDEYDVLHAPSSIGKRALYGMQRLSLKTLGRLSDGIRLGWRTGFDSGESLDYVYENRARGITPPGRWIDRYYLDTVGWEGIRRRKIHLQEALDQAIADAAASGESVRIVDVAAGCGRYVLDTLARHRGKAVSALLRDYSPGNLIAGRRVADAMNCLNATFERGDAFNREELARITPRPNVVIVSGLYELFPDNGRVMNSLGGIADLLAPGGTLIYTCQPWHPQVELIARTLDNRNGEPWIMRRRTQAEMDALVAAAGFRKQSMRIDDHGIFTVSTAMRESPAARQAA